MRTIFFSFLLVTLCGTFAIAQDQPKLVKLVEVQAGASETTRQFFGHAVAKETVDLAFQVGGQIVDIPIVEGQPIAQGATVAVLDLEPFEIALDQARVQKDQADRTLARFQALQGSAVSQVSVDDAETQVQLAEIAVRNAERSLNSAQLTAPFDGLVAARNVANFSTIAAGTPIARLHDMSEIRVEIDVPEVLFGRAGRDPDVALWAQLPGSDTRYPLEAREFNAETSQVGQTFQITLAMDPPDDLIVFPGASVTVYATLRGGPDALRIPQSAVITSTDGMTQVLAFTTQDGTTGTVSAVPVAIEPAPNGDILVLEGLEPGQEIVASGAHLLNDGDAVTRFTGFAN
ncbi:MULTISPECIES: efflux RND transporter periplasmic adaptor subunit [Roseobacteraceae]|nr:efflux RND transporter periplasmic adaptor subunit [Litoreibacter arenae]|tara:strand:+ start:476 stop:1513 length:1038 start_codon:yes stop_codon:yes gene_type:complete